MCSENVSGPDAGAPSPTPRPARADDRVGRMSRPEFMALMGAAMGIVAFSVDAMLPSLARIASDLSVAQPNDRQLVVLAFMFGLSLSPVFFGVAADSFGRRRPLMIGFAIYAAGSALAAFAPSFESLLLGRLLQGVGAGGPRVLAVAIIRDRFEGRTMARILSFVMMLFILAPMIAPAIGLAIAVAAGWRMVFGLLLVLALSAIVWVYLRLPETLAEQNVQRLDLGSVLSNLRIALTCREAMLYIAALGCLFAAFLSYISSVQQLIGEAYGFGDAFIYVFAGLAMAIFVAVWVNARVVERLGMRFLTLWPLRVLIALSTGAAAATLALGQPPFWAFVLWSAPSFFCVGLLFGNLNALAMRPLGRIAGLGAALALSLPSFIAAPFAAMIGRFYDGSPAMLQVSFAVLSVAALALARAADGARINPQAPATPATGQTR